MKEMMTVSYDVEFSGQKALGQSGSINHSTHDGTKTVTPIIRNEQFVTGNERLAFRDVVTAAHGHANRWSEHGVDPAGEREDYTNERSVFVKMNFALAAIERCQEG